MIRVAVVDDDYRVAEVHAAYVNQISGFEVVGMAHTARAGIELAQSSAADLIVLDQYLPDGSGLSVIRQVSCDVMMVTAASDGAAVREALRLGAFNYLLKPFTEIDLAARLQAYAQYRSVLGVGSVLEQTDIDRAFRTLHQGDRIDASLPKGRTSRTAQMIVNAIRTSPEPLTAGGIADELGISRGTAQRYLSDLAADGHVTVGLRYGVSGRPEHLYTRPM